MISFDTFQPIDGTPIYQQILLFIKRGAVAGTIRNGDELPSRRMLSALLGINPNTVQKAVHLLEEEGLIESTLGAGSNMTLTQQKLKELREELLKDDIRGIIRSLRQTGISKEEAIQLINLNWEESGDE